MKHSVHAIYFLFPASKYGAVVGQASSARLLTRHCIMS